LPEEGILAVGEQVAWVQAWMDDFGDLVAVGALLDDEDGELRISFSEPASDDATC